MSKFSRFETTVRPKERPWSIHPIWQGIGCLMMVLIPLMSYAGAVLLVKANLQYRWVPFPREFIGPPGRPLLYGQLGVTVLLSMFGFLVFVIVYSIIYRFVGPPKYGPTDAPPARRRNVRSTSKKRK
jgi:hypothetical protein